MTTEGTIEPGRYKAKITGQSELVGECDLSVDEAGLTIRKKRRFGDKYISITARWGQVDGVGDRLKDKRFFSINSLANKNDRPVLLDIRIQILDGDITELRRRLFSSLGLKFAPSEATTVVFKADSRLNMPDQCVGCSANNPTDRISLTIFAIPSLSGGAKALKGAAVLFGLATGGLGGAVGHAHLVDRLKKARAVSSLSLPFCTDCQKRFSLQDRQRLSEPCENLFNNKGVVNVFFSIKTVQDCAVLSLLNRDYASALQELNPGVIHPTVESCVAAETKKGSQPDIAPGIQSLPTVTSDALREYEIRYGRALTPIEAATVQAWSARVGTTQQSLFSYPSIPDRKLANARAGYASVTEDELILGLQDSTVFGSAKEGALFTTQHIYWKSIGSSKAESVPYAEIVPSSVSFKSSFTKKEVQLGSDRHLLLACVTNERPLAALSAFIADAASFARIAKPSGGTDV